MKTLTALFMMVLIQQYAVHVDAVSATIYSGSMCGGNPLTSIDNVPSGACYSFHGRTDITTPTSGRITCAGTTSGSSWSAQVHGVFVSNPTSAEYSCQSLTPVMVSGTGLGCVAIALNLYSVSVDCTVDSSGIKVVSAGGIEAAMDRTEPFNLKLAPEGNITAGQYLRVSYRQLGEITAGESPVPDETGVTPNKFHSVPLTDLVIASNLALYTADTPYYAFVGYVGGVPQYYSTNVSAAGINLNFLAKSSFSLASYNVTLPGDVAETQVCLRGSSNGACTPFQVNAGTLKNAIGLYNWEYAAAAAKFRIQYNMQLVGLPSATVYFNGNTGLVPGSFTGQVTSITWISDAAPYAFVFTLVVQQNFNKGDNTFAAASVTSTGSATSLSLNVDIPLAQLAVPSGVKGWWLYDPDFALTTAAAGSLTTSGVSSTFATSVAALLAVVAAAVRAVL